MSDPRPNENARPFATFPWIEAYKSGIDRTLIRRNLAMSIEERCDQLIEMAKLQEELERNRRTELD